MISYISFIHPIHVGGDLNAIEKWQAAIEGKELDLAERGGFIVLTNRAGEQWRTPVTNVKYIRETTDKAKK